MGEGEPNSSSSLSEAPSSPSLGPQNHQAATLLSKPITSRDNCVDDALAL